MSVAKFYIWGGGRWREVSSTSGEVAGWSRRPRFVFARRGRLRVASRRRVLAALQAHAENQPSAIGLGPRLSVLSGQPKDAVPVKALPSAPPAVCGYHHCCIYTHGCRDNNFTKCRHSDPPTLHECCTRSVATEVAAYPTGAALTNAAVQPACDVTLPRKTADAAVQHSPTNHPTLTISLNKLSPQKSNTETRRSAETEQPSSVGAKSGHASTLDTLLTKHSSPVKRQPSPTTDDSERHFRNCAKTNSTDTQKPAPRARKVARKKQRSVSEDNGSPGPVCKELTISESDVMALRSYVARCREDALERFDADDDYKRMLFYAINPLVDVTRCAHTERALRDHRALQHFAARLGLTPAPERRTDKENRQTTDQSNSDERPLKYSPRKRTTHTKYLRSRRELFLKRLETSNGRKSLSSQVSRYNANRVVARKGPEIAGSTEDLLESKAKSISNRYRGTEKESSDSADNFVKTDKRRDKHTHLNKGKSPKRPNAIESASEEQTESVKNLEDGQNGVKRDSLRARSKRKYISVSSESDDNKSNTTHKSNSVESSKDIKGPRTEDKDQNRPESAGVSQRSQSSDGYKRRSLRNLSKAAENSTGSRKSRRRSALPLSVNYVDYSSEDTGGSSKVVARKGARPLRYSGVNSVTVSKEDPSESKPVQATDNSASREECVSAPRVPVSTAGPSNVNKQINKRRAKFTDYSDLEDHAIVSMLCEEGGRARLVNGNTMWMGLQEQYQRMTGRRRTWHSLRNRYLRYILPALGALHVSPHTAARLRAAAATGSLKRRGVVPRRASIFDQSEVRSASTRTRTRTHPATRTSDEGDVARLLTNPQPTGVKGPLLRERRSLVTSLPTNVRRTGSPSKSNRTGSPPKKLRRTRSPTNARRRRSPSNSRRTGSPSNTRRTGSPSNTRRTGSPSNSRRTGSPSNTRRTGSPSNSRRTGSPPNSRRTGSPSNSRRTGSPSNSRRTGSPSNSRRTGSPSNSHRSESPTNVRRRGLPRNVRLTGSPSKSRLTRSVSNVRRSGVTKSPHRRETRGSGGLPHTLGALGNYLTLN